MRNIIIICVLVIGNTLCVYGQNAQEQKEPLPEAEAIAVNENNTLSAAGHTEEIPVEEIVITIIDEEETALSQPEEISAQALAAAPFLFTDRNSKGYLIPGNGTVEKPKGRSAYQIYDKVVVKLPGKTSYNLGDTVDVLKPVKLVPFKGKSAQIISRSGRGVVTGHSGKKIVIQLTNMWGIVAGGEKIAPAVNFKPVKYGIKPQTDSKIQASVVTRVEESTSPYLNQFFIIDRGADAGVNIGDFFKVFEKPSGNKLSDDLIEAQVVYVGGAHSTLVIRKIFKENLKSGDQAFLSHKSVLLEADDSDSIAAEED